MKYRHKKIKREHSIIKGALDWLEDLSLNREVTDIIPGVIDTTRSRERGVFYQYETPTGCKLLLKNNGSIQEAFVVTKNPHIVKEWVKKKMEDLALLETFPINPDEIKQKKAGKEQAKSKGESSSISPKKNKKPAKALFGEEYLKGIKRDYRLVQINQRLRDSYVESLACMADLDSPTIKDILEPSVHKALEDLENRLEQYPIRKNEQVKSDRTRDK